MGVLVSEDNWYIKEFDFKHFVKGYKYKGKELETRFGVTLDLPLPLQHLLLLCRIKRMKPFICLMNYMKDA